MRTSYGVVWREGEHPLARGKLELLPRTMRLDGMTGSEPTTREISYDYLSEIRIGRSPEERIDGRPSLVLAPRSGDTFSIASVAQAGVLAEIAERLTALQLGTEAHRRLTVVLPVKEEARRGSASTARRRPALRSGGARPRPTPGLSHRDGGDLHLRVQARRRCAGAAAAGHRAVAERRSVARSALGTAANRGGRASHGRAPTWTSTAHCSRPGSAARSTSKPEGTPLRDSQRTLTLLWRDRAT